MSQAVLLLGGGGLLGSAVGRAIPAGVPLVAPRVAWDSPELARGQFVTAVDEVTRVAAGGWVTVLWCAGAGVPNSPASIFDVERQVLGSLLQVLAEQPQLDLHRTVFFLASSAGAVYAGVEAPPYDEHSPVRPLAPYGHAKLRLEEMVAGACSTTGMRGVCGRFSNLYGPGQNLTKAQGLVSVLLDNALARRPSQIYVSLDTIRDYLYVDDAAALALGCVRRAAQEPPGSCTAKVLASGQRLTIGSLLGLTRQTVRRRPLIVQGASPHAKVQARDLSMGSCVWPEVDARPMTSIVEGMHRTYSDLLNRRRAAQLP